MSQEFYDIPSGILSISVDGKEVRLVKISKELITFRIKDKYSAFSNISAAFYNIDENSYKEFISDKVSVLDVRNKEFYYEYDVSAQLDSEYFKWYDRIISKYSGYITYKNNSIGSEFSKYMVNYPSEKDEEFNENFAVQKREIFSDCDINMFFDKISSIKNTDIKINSHQMYEKYLNTGFTSFIKDYFLKNFLELNDENINRINGIYIGSQFCHNQFPDMELLEELLKKAVEDKLNITLEFTYMREDAIKRHIQIIDYLYGFCREHHIKIRLVINDFGMLELLKNKDHIFIISYGILLNKIRKDPRIKYKSGGGSMPAGNSLEYDKYMQFLENKGISSYEYESGSRESDIIYGKSSLTLPFYQTNTSQYCPLNAYIKTGDRGRQALALKCGHMCEKYVFLYPSHLKTVGKYNSIFAYDDEILKNTDKIDYYIEKGIDRIVFDFLN